MILTRHPQRLIRSIPRFSGNTMSGGRELSQAGLPVPLHQAGRKGGDGNLHFQFAKLGAKIPRGFQSTFSLAAGAQVYEEALPRCSDSHSMVVKCELEGDAFFPAFEDKFDLGEKTARETPESRFSALSDWLLFALEEPASKA